MPTLADMGMAYFSYHSNQNYIATKITLELNVKNGMHTLAGIDMAYFSDHSNQNYISTKIRLELKVEVACLP